MVAANMETSRQTVPMTMPPPDKRLTSGKFKDLLTYLGPGIIVASATIGNGEVFFSSRGGAIFGYALLWTFLLGAVMKGIVVYSGTKYITLTGEHPFRRWGRIMPGPKNWLATFLGAIAVISFPAWISAFMKITGQWTTWTFGLSSDYEKLFATMFGLIAFVILFVASFSRMEKIMNVIVAVLVLFALVAVFVARPDWSGVFRGLVPNVPTGYEGWVQAKYPDIAAKPTMLEIISYLGALGGGTYDYIGYVGTLREKNWGLLGNPDLDKIQQQMLLLKKGEECPLPEDEKSVRTAFSWLKAVKMDTSVSFVAVFIVGSAFMILGSVILGTGGLQVIPTDNETIQNQMRFFTNISPVMSYFYKIAIFCAFFGGLVSLSTTVYPATFRESFGPTFPALYQPKNNSKLRVAVCAYSILGGLFVLWTGFSYSMVISFASIIGGVFSLGVWGFAMLWTEKKILPKAYRFKPVMVVLIFISSLIMFVMGLIAFLQFIHVI